MPPKHDYSKDIDPIIDQAEEIIHFFKIEKDSWAEVYIQKNFEEMNLLSIEVIKKAKEFAHLFYYKEERRKWKSSMDLNKVKDFRADRRITQLALSISRMAEILRQDCKALNMQKFMYHSDQTEKKMYAMLNGCERIIKQGIDGSRVPRKQVSQSHLISENMDSWKKFVKETKLDDKEEELDPLEEMNRIMSEVEEEN